MVRLVLISTSGNQAYIFASNRLREAVGASRLLVEWTTERVADAADARGGVVVQASSGSTLVLVPDEDSARALVTDVTLGALRAAPGLAISGVSIEIDADHPTQDEIAAVFAEHARHVARRPGTAARHQRTPLVAACASTDAPAASWHTDLSTVPPAGTDDPPAPRSAEVIAKRAARHAADRRIRDMLAGDERLAGRRLIDIDRFFESVGWVAVVHADGNGLGAFFRAATTVLAGRTEGARTALGALSDEVRDVAEGALRDAVTELESSEKMPLVPLIVGGDDLTVLVDGGRALPFVEAYLTGFAARAASKPLVGEVLAHLGVPALTAAAGVALVKPHFPFSVAHRLAEELCQEAKRRVAAHPGSHGIDAHVLIDSTVTDLDAIRERYRRDVPGQVVLTERPFLLAGPGATIPPEHDWTLLRRRLDMIAGIPPGGRQALTRNQLAALREELRTDPELARRRLARLHGRAQDDLDRSRLDALRGDDGLARGLLDLLELAPFVRSAS